VKLAGLPLGDWIRALGRTVAGWQPDMVDSVQPVVLVGDHRLMTPPVFAGGGVFGCWQTNDVGAPRTTCYEITPGGAGGAMVTRFWGSFDHIDSAVSDGEPMMWRLSALPFTYILGPTNVPAQDFDPRFPLRSTLVKGATSTLLSATQTIPFLPLFTNAVAAGVGFAAFPLFWEGPFYIPPGLKLQAQIALPAGSEDRSYFGAIVYDVPAQRS